MEVHPVFTTATLNSLPTSISRILPRYTNYSISLLCVVGDFIATFLNGTNLDPFVRIFVQ